MPQINQAGSPLERLWLLALTAAVTGCVSSSVGDDVRYVQRVTEVEALPPLHAAEVDPLAAREAERLLAEPLDAEAAVRVALLDNRELRARLREIGITRGEII